MSKKIDSLIMILKKSELTLATAESASCGELANIIGSYDGVSSIYKGGFITYSNELKESLLDIPSDEIKKSGSISYEIARLMARQTTIKTKAHITISITGNAGPKPIEDKPIGKFYIGINYIQKTICYEVQLDPNNSRDENRHEIAEKALELLYDFLMKQK